MAVRVRLFAAVREAAGTAEDELAPGVLPDLLATLVDRYGEPFATRLRACTVLLDGSAVGREAAIDVSDGAELALLPPVSGGAVAARRGADGQRLNPQWLDPLLTAAAVSGLAGVAVVALLAGPQALAAATVAASVATLLELSVLFRRAGDRPVLLAALLPAVAMPLAALRDPTEAWERIPVLVALTVLAAFVLLVVSRRRRRVTAALAATCVAGVTVGVGATCLVLLRARPEGLRWCLSLVLLLALPVVAGSVAEAVVGRGAVTLATRVIVLGAVAGALAAAFDPPVGVPAAAVLAVVAAVATPAARVLAGPEAVAVRRPRVGGGAVVTGCGAGLLAAPGAYLLARALGA